MLDRALHRTSSTIEMDVLSFTPMPESGMSSIRAKKKTSAWRKKLIFFFLIKTLRLKCYITMCVCISSLSGWKKDQKGVGLKMSKVFNWELTENEELGSEEIIITFPIISSMLWNFVN